jgi:hypothetical protein
MAPLIHNLSWHPAGGGGKHITYRTSQVATPRVARFYRIAVKLVKFSQNREAPLKKNMIKGQYRVRKLEIDRVPEKGQQKKLEFSAGKRLRSKHLNQNN